MGASEGTCALKGKGGFSCVTRQRLGCLPPLTHGPRHQINVEEDHQLVLNGMKKKGGKEVEVVGEN